MSLEVCVNPNNNQKHEFSMNGREERIFAAHQIKNDLRMRKSFEFDEFTIHENVAQRLPDTFNEINSVMFGHRLNNT